MPLLPSCHREASASGPSGGRGEAKILHWVSRPDFLNRINGPESGKGLGAARVTHAARTQCAIRIGSRLWPTTSRVVPPSSISRQGALP